MKHPITPWLMAALVVGAVALAACDPAVGPDIRTLLPKPNLTLRVNTYALDYASKRPENSVPGREWITVSPDTSSFRGRSVVTRLVARTDTSRRSDGDTTFVHMLDNGDIEVLHRFERPFRLKDETRWMRFPFGLKGTTTTIAADTVWSINSTGYRYRETWTASFLGPERLDTGLLAPLVMRGDLATLKAQVLQTVEVATNLSIPTVSTLHTLWYSPKLGTIVRSESVVQRPAGSTNVGGGAGWETVGFYER